MFVADKPEQRGSLYVVATPIGHLGDLSARALETLKTVNVIAAEDTRVTRGLLAHFGIGTRLIAVHEHNERDAAQGIVKLLDGGQSVALVSDAGTPGVSDPGALVVRAVRAAGFDVIPIPGACALTAALSASGMGEHGFSFAGFLPARNSERAVRLKDLAARREAIVFYEAPHRIEETVEALRVAFGDAVPVLIAREVTKKFEQLHVAPLGEAATWLAADENHRRGEFVIVVENSSTGAQIEDKSAQTQALERTLAILCEELPLKQAVAIAVKLTGEKRNLVYERALALKNGRGEG
ncbi:MAG: 16S rRNA (cytidine(1402)-2'-O)-methyltransferase [Betaproteobacteria bacterium]|nr:16S rRNA (cytidine(1402)-2'-O)-methyltransferase [Betaproteobacteria bacterium]